MSPSNNIVIDEKLLDSYRDLNQRVKDVRVKLVRTADEVEILFNKLCQGIVRQDLQVALSSNAKQYEQFAVEKLVEEVSVKLPQDYETNLQQMRNLKSVALQVLKKVEEFDAENV